MQHHIIVVGSREKVDALIAKFRSDHGITETSQPIDQLASLGFREFYFEQNEVGFILRNLSTAQANDQFIHLDHMKKQLPLANLCIICDADNPTIEFLNLANNYSVGAVSYMDGIDIIDEIKRKSSAKNISLAIESETISKDFVQKPTKLERTVNSTFTLFAANLRLATNTPPQAPVVEQAITNMHL